MYIFVQNAYKIFGFTSEMFLIFSNHSGTVSNFCKNIHPCSYHHFFELSGKKSRKVQSKNFGMSFWKLVIPANISREVWSIHQMKAKITCNWQMNLVLRFTLKKLKKVSKKSFQNFLIKLSENLFWKVLKDDDRNRVHLMRLWDDAFLYCY